MHGLAEDIHIPDVSFEQAYVLQERSDVFHPATGEVVQYSDGAVSIQKRSRQMRSDESCATGDQEKRTAGIHLIVLELA